MPIRKLRLSKSEAQEHHASLLRLKEIGIDVGCEAESSSEPGRVVLEQVNHQAAMLYQLPWGEVGVIFFAKVTVLSCGVFITNLEVTMPWGDVLGLEAPEACSTYYDPFSELCPRSQPKFLNSWLAHNIPLRPRREEGAIVATGPGFVPAEYDYLAPVEVKLFLTDRCNELCFDLVARVDRISKYKCREWAAGLEELDVSEEFLRLIIQQQKAKKSPRQQAHPSSGRSVQPLAVPIAA